jgi:hypothetical protein
MALGRLLLGALCAALVAALAPACSRTATVIDVYTALDSNGNRKRNVFYTDTSEIHCIAEAGNSRKDATFSMQLRALQLYDFDTQTTFDTNRVLNAVEFAPGPSENLQFLDAQLKKTHAAAKDDDAGAGDDEGEEEKTPFDVGRFVCEVYLDGDLAGAATFNVLVPPCPDAAVIPKALCYKFFDKNTICPAFGLTSTDPLTCRCDEVQGWDCAQ